MAPEVLAIELADRTFADEREALELANDTPREGSKYGVVEDWIETRYLSLGGIDT